MPVPPLLHDPQHIETRLLVVAEMLERAVAEVNRVVDEIKAVAPLVAPPTSPPGTDTFPRSAAAPGPDPEDNLT
jgi:hypothetical protein